MPLLQAVEILVVVGVPLWLVNRLHPQQSSIKSILSGVLVIARSSLAPQCLRPFPFRFSYAYWIVKDEPRNEHERENTIQALTTT
jgi:hypothetical protein